MVLFGLYDCFVFKEVLLDSSHHFFLYFGCQRTLSQVETVFRAALTHVCQ